MPPARLHVLPPEVLDEDQLLEGLRAGSPEAFRTLYQVYLPRVASLARVLLRGTGVEDAVQETFLRVFRNVQHFRGDSRLATWIYRITSNVCLSELRHRGTLKARHGSYEETARQEEMAERDPEAELALRQSSQHLQGLLDQLDPLKRTTFFLHHAEGLTAAEIGTVLGEQRGTVLKRLQRTREELLARWPKTAGESGVEERDRARSKRGSP